MDKIIQFFILCGGFLCTVGYVMNFQNLFTYTINSTEFVVSVIGIFVPVLGIVTGWVW